MKNILYNDTYCIGIEELNNIYIALLTCADHIYINEGVEVDWQLPAEIYSHIQQSLDVLHKNHLLIYWDFPYKEGISNADIFLDKNQYMQWNNIINNIYFNGEELHSIYNFLCEGKTLLSPNEENTSKILLMRREYWTYALLNILSVDNVLVHHPGRLKMVPDQLLEQPSLCDKAVEMMFSDTVSNVFSLTGNDIVYLSNKNEKIRDLTNKKIDERSLLDSFQADQYDSLLQSAVTLAKEKYKNRKWERYDNIKDATVTISGFIANLTPIGPLYNNICDVIGLCKNIVGALPIDRKADQDFCIILAKFNGRLKHQIERRAGQDLIGKYNCVNDVPDGEIDC